MHFNIERETVDGGELKKWIWTEKAWTIAQIQGRELWKYYWKNLIKFSQIFQMPGLMKMNIANAELIFDQNECDIQILQ